MIIDTTHGAVAGASRSHFVHRNLLDLDRLETFLCARARPYVPLEACLRGEGDAFTLDDSTVAAAVAARLARQLGHAVTLFINGWNIEQAKPYFFSRLNVALDNACARPVIFRGISHDLRSAPGKQRFRAFVKSRLARMGAEADRQDLVTEVGRLLGVSDLSVPDYLKPLAVAELKALAGDGVDIQNHGWTHVQIGALPLAAHAADIRAGRDWLELQLGTDAGLFAVPNGDGLPPAPGFGSCRAWFLLDARRPAGPCGPGLINRRTLNL